MAASKLTRPTSESRVQMTEMVLPEDSNSRGSIFGGRVLALVDKCAAVVALRHTRTGVVTLRLDSVEFRNPVQVGDILVLNGRLNAVFGSSMEIEVNVLSEHPASGRQRLTTTAFVTMVAVGEDGRPIPAPALEVRTDKEERRIVEATKRREHRLAQRRGTA